MVERKLVAVQAADIAGYSRLTALDEEGSTEQLQKVMRAAKSRIAEVGGEPFTEAGDGLLAQIPSPLSAIHCSIEIQRDLNLLNYDLADDRQMRMRIGVTVADALVVGFDLYGDSVNAAARIESIAGPGEVFVNETVFELVRRTNKYSFEDKGLFALKNMSEEQRLFRVIGEVEATRSGRFHVSERKDIEKSSPVSRPSVAVLPFSVIGSDPEQEYFADGATDDIITELARFGSLTVTSRTATFAYKDKGIDFREVGRELGVHYVLEGSVRRSADRVRVTAQLIETADGGHVWAERYDRQINDLFDIQDDLVRKIAGTLVGRLHADATDRARRKKPADLEAYDCLLRGLEHHRFGGVSKEHADKAVQWIEKAIDKDPEFARAHAWRACVSTWMWPPDDDHDTVIARSRNFTTRALELDENEPEAHRIMGAICLLAGEFDKAKFHHLRAIELNPNDADLLARGADFCVCDGDAGKAIEMIEASKSIDPFVSEYTRVLEAKAFYFAERYSDAITAFHGLQKPSRMSLAVAVAASVNLTDAAALEAHRSNLLRLDPDFTIQSFLDSSPPFRSDRDREKFSDDLAAGGLPQSDHLSSH